MKNIDIEILNPSCFSDIRRTIVFAARLTQHGHEIHTVQDAENLYNKPYSDELINGLCRLPHPTLQKFGVINIIVTGASRRFLSQITRHQNEVKFMSASLQYSDYSGNAAFVVPYGILAAGSEETEKYLDTCYENLKKYSLGIEKGIDNDSIGYLMPQALRNIILISATPYQWRHMIHQRICRRNTDETRIIMLKIWQRLAFELPEIFFPEAAGPFCMHGFCKEGRMSCKNPISPVMTPVQILKNDYPLLFKEDIVNED